MVIPRDLGFDVMPSVAGSFSGKLLIHGCGRCLWDDLDKIGKWDGHRMAINYSGILMAVDFDHWISLHQEDFPWMLYLRGRTIHGKTPRPNFRGHVHHIGNWPGDREGTSSLFAARVGAALGYDEIVMAGVPMDSSGHFYDPPGYDGGSDYSGTAERWRKYAPILREKVKVVSGNLVNLLGGYNGNS